MQDKKSSHMALCVKVYAKIMISYHKGGHMSCKIKIITYGPLCESICFVGPIRKLNPVFDYSCTQNRIVDE